MELAVLNSSFQRERLIENWNSLVWTERYSSNGDFQLVSNRISDIMELLPLGAPLDPPTLVSIEGSDVPMVVENHKIEKTKAGIPQITTTGRSFETVLDRRINVKADTTTGTPRVEYHVDANNAAAAAYSIAHDIVVTGTLSANDVIPEITLLNSASSAGTTQSFPVDAKELYAWMMDTLALGKYGLKAELSALTTIALIIYEGTDRSSEVAFDVALDQFDQAAYLFSNAPSKNVMYTSGKYGMEHVTLESSEPSGLSRRVGFNNLESEITAYSPGNATLISLLQNKGKISLSSLVPVALFSGGVSISVGAGYNDTYFLGDIVKLRGEYGLSQNARVAEFVRTQDTTGSKAYPTFEAVS